MTSKKKTSLLHVVMFYYSRKSLVLSVTIFLFYVLHTLSRLHGGTSITITAIIVAHHTHSHLS